VKKRMGKIIKKIKILVNLFFLRFFRNENMPFENEAEAKFIFILVLFSVLSLFFSFNLLFKYVFVPENGNSWQEKSQIILIFMLVIGFITVLEWDVLLPDKSDFYVLGPLPLGKGIILSSKFISFLSFVGLFAFTTNFLSALFFPVFLTAFYSHSSPFFFILFSIVHLIISFLANIFTFFFFLFISNFLFILLPSKFFKKVSSMVRGMVMIAILSIYAFLPELYSFLPEMVNRGDKRIFYFPHLWFTGFYENLLGRSNSLTVKMSRLSILSVIVVLFLSFITYGIAFYKNTRSVSKSREGSSFAKKHPSYSISRIFHNLLFKSQPEKAIFYFLKKTLKRSEKHRVKLYSFLAVSIGIIISKYLTEQNLLKNVSNFKEWSKVIYSAPFIIWFFYMAGLRSIANNPYNPSANWIFKITEKKDKAIYHRAIHKFNILQNIIPISLLLFLFYLFVWDIKKSLIITFFSFFAAFFIEEILFFNIKKIPYTCISLPDKGNLKMLFIPYLLLFLFYTQAMGYFSYWIVEYPHYFKNLLYIGILLLLFLFIIKRIFEKREFSLVFEEEPEPEFLSLEL